MAAETHLDDATWQNTSVTELNQVFLRGTLSSERTVMKIERKKQNFLFFESYFTKERFTIQFAGVE